MYVLKQSYILITFLHIKFHFFITLLDLNKSKNTLKKFLKLKELQTCVE